MKHELKVIMGETARDTIVLVDDEQIGFIQELKFHVSVDQQIPIIEMVFPDLEPFKESNRTSVTKLDRHMELLREIPNVKITLKELEFPEAK